MRLEVLELRLEAEQFKMSSSSSCVPDELLNNHRCTAAPVTDYDNLERPVPHGMYSLENTAAWPSHDRCTAAWQHKYASIDEYLAHNDNYSCEHAMLESDCVLDSTLTDNTSSTASCSSLHDHAALVDDYNQYDPSAASHLYQDTTTPP